MTYRAVLFDLDGTLLNTLEDLANSMNAVLQASGFPVHEVEEYKYFVGDGMENLVRRALPGPERHREPTVAACLDAMRREYNTRQRETTRPYEGVPELLDALVGRGMRMAILSNKPHESTVEVVGDLLSRWAFDAILGAQPGKPRKPDPAVALEIAAFMGVPCHEFLYVGDTNTDMQTANAAGMFAVGALWGFRKADELLAFGAKALIEKPEDVLQFLDPA